MNVLFYIIYSLVLFFIVRKLTIVILTNYFNKKIREKELLIVNENKVINNDNIILQGTIERNFEIKKDIMNRNPNQKLCEKYNKNVYRGLDGRYKSFKK
jgi:hypothetical protein